MEYSHKTGQFPANELMILQNASAEQLINSLLGGPTIVALRAIAEVMLNGDDEKLRVMFRSNDFTAHWRRYFFDDYADDRDRSYAQQLEIKMVRMGF